MNMNIFMIGDIVSGPGRSVVRDYLAGRDDLDFVVANGENAAGGLGITEQIAFQLQEYGVDVITTGNHVWKKTDFVDRLEEDPEPLNTLRPLNYPAPAPGPGYRSYRCDGTDILVVNLQGRTFMEPIDCPFERIDNLLEERDEDVILVDFHAEATSEKRAMAQYLDGRVTAVVGTHTHVQTADEQILADGTAYLTDLGMTGPYNSTIGVRHELARKRFLTGRPTRFKVEKRGPRMINGLIVSLDDNAVTNVERVNEQLPERTH